MKPVDYFWIGMIISVVLILFLGLLTTFIILILTRRKPPRVWLMKELDKWEKEELISRDLKDSLIKKYTPPAKESMPPTKIVILCGSILLGIGLIIFIASNWKNISPEIKLIFTFLLSLIALFYGYYLKFNEKKPMPILGEGLMLVSTLIWGATIIFLFQHYQIAESNNYIMTLLWGASIFPIALWFKSDPVYYLSYFLLFLTGIFRGNLLESPCYLFLILGLIPFLLISENKKHRWIPVSSLAILLPIFTNHFSMYDTFYLGLMAIFILFWWLKKENLYLLMGSIVQFFFILSSIQSPLLKSSLGNWFFLIPFLMLLSLYLWKKVSVPLYILLPTLYLGLFFLLADDSIFYDFPISLTKIILMVGLFYLLLERFIRHFPSKIPFLGWGYLGIIIPSFVLSFQALILDSLQNKPIHGLLFLGNFRPFFYLSVLSVAVVLGLLLLWLMKKPEKEPGDQFMIALSGLILISLSIWELFGIKWGEKSTLLITVVQNATLLCVLLFTIFWAAKRSLNWLINIGLGLFLIFIILRYFDLSWKLLDRSWFFIGGGVILLVIGFFMEKVRRKLVRGDEKNEE